MREVCFLIGRGGSILWADASTTPTALPDSRARWEAIWQHRAELEAIVHSHPIGPAAFSAEDLSTMQALDAALGKAMSYCVVAPRLTLARCDGREHQVTPEPWWAGLLRLASGLQQRERKED
jgi:proteasome lid subunit RPN8/RPN11